MLLTAKLSPIKRMTWRDFRGLDGELDLKALYSCNIPLPYIHAHYYGLETRLTNAWELYKNPTERDLVLCTILCLIEKALKKIRYASPLYRILKLNQLQQEQGLVVVSSSKGTPPVASPEAVGSIPNTICVSIQEPFKESGCRHFLRKLFGTLLNHDMFLTHFTRSVAHMLRLNITWETQH